VAIEELVVFDLEYTAWEGSLDRLWSADNEDPEIIQIGAVLLQRSFNAWRLVKTFEQYVRPRYRPVLSNYITALTGISQDVIDLYGVDVRPAVSAFTKLIPENTPIIHIGPMDGWILQFNCAINGFVCPIPINRFIDVRPFIAGKLNYRLEDVWSGGLGQMMGFPSNRAHNALNDAIAVATALSQLDYMGQVVTDNNYSG